MGSLPVRSWAPHCGRSSLMNVKCKWNFLRHHLLVGVDEVTPAEIGYMSWFLPPSTPILSILQNPLTTQGFLTAPTGILHCSRTGISCNSIAVPSLTSIPWVVTCPVLTRPPGSDSGFWFSSQQQNSKNVEAALHSLHSHWPRATRAEQMAPSQTRSLTVWFLASSWKRTL